MEKMMFVVDSVPRWVRVSAVLLGVGLGSEVLYEAYLGWRSSCEARRARQRASRHINEVYFTKERSTQSNAPGTSMASFTTEHVGRIVALLDRARVSVCLGMYIITVSSIGDALLKAANRGVRVRVVGCSSMAYSSGSQMTRLSTAGIPVRFDGKDSAYLMHHKFCLIDTDWFCQRCYHEERVRSKGFCCGAVFDKRGGSVSVSGSGEGQISASEGGAGGSPTRKVQCVDDGSRCVRCDPQLKMEVERRRLKPEATEPLPIGGLMVTGSTNWTMQAMSGNWDNMVVTSMPELVTPFQLEFQKLWREFDNHAQLMGGGGGGGAGDKQ